MLFWLLRAMLARSAEGKRGGREMERDETDNDLGIPIADLGVVVALYVVQGGVAGLERCVLRNCRRQVWSGRQHTSVAILVRSETGTGCQGAMG